MNRKEMEDVIRGGSGVLLEGRVYTSVDELPEEVELVNGKPEEQQRLAGDLEKQMAQIQAQLQRLQAAQPKNEQPKEDARKEEVKADAKAK